MSDKWIDKPDYFGPDRRRLRQGKRWRDQRRHDESSEPPPLGAILRRMRVLLLGMHTPEDRTRFLQMTRAAITRAETARERGCADALRQAAQVVQTRDLKDGAMITEADAILIEAMGRLAHVSA